MRNFLFFDGATGKNDFLLKLMDALAVDGWQPILLSRAGSVLSEAFKVRHWRQKHLSFCSFGRYRLAAFGWLGWLLWFVRLVIYRKTWHIDTVFCIGWSAKFLITMPAGLLGLRVIWLEQPNFCYNDLGKWEWRLFRMWSTKAQLVCFSLTTKVTLLSLGISEDRLSVIWPGIALAELQNQNALFQNLIQNHQPVEYRKKFFTLGTVVDLQGPQRIEVLMRAMQAASVVAPNLRLIVIGDGLARRQVEWLSKQLSLESAVWLVGSQVDLKKWYANFDLFIVASQTPDLDDFTAILGAMVNGVPVIAPAGLSLDDCFLGGKAGLLLSLTDVEELSAAIINLIQDASLRKELSVNAKKVVKDFFTLERVKHDIKLILENK